MQHNQLEQNIQRVLATIDARNSQEDPTSKDAPIETYHIYPTHGGIFITKEEPNIADTPVIARRSYHGFPYPNYTTANRYPRDNPTSTSTPASYHHPLSNSFRNWQRPPKRYIRTRHTYLLQWLIYTAIYSPKYAAYHSK